LTKKVPDFVYCKQQKIVTLQTNKSVREKKAREKKTNKQDL